MTEKELYEITQDAYASIDVIKSKCGWGTYKPETDNEFVKERLQKLYVATGNMVVIGNAWKRFKTLSPHLVHNFTPALAKELNEILFMIGKGTGIKNNTGTHALELDLDKVKTKAPNPYIGENECVIDKGDLRVFLKYINDYEALKDYSKRKMIIQNIIDLGKQLCKENDIREVK